MFRLERLFKNTTGELFNYLRKVEEAGDLIIERLQGAIDAATIPVIEEGLKGRIEKYLDKNILLDFKDVTHVDSATLAALIILLDQLQCHHRRLGIINPHPELMSYLAIEKIDKLVRVYEDEAQAVADLR